MRILFIFSLVFASNLAFCAEAYENPVDRKSYVADWKLYRPNKMIADQNGKVTNSGIRLLNTQNEFEKNITVDELAKLIGYIKERLAEKSQKYHEGGEIVLQITLNKEKNPEFKMSYQGNLGNELLQSFYDSLAGIELKTKQSSVTFQINFVMKQS